MTKEGWWDGVAPAEDMLPMRGIKAPHRHTLHDPASDFPRLSNQREILGEICGSSPVPSYEGSVDSTIKGSSWDGSIGGFRSENQSPYLDSSTIWDAASSSGVSSADTEQMTYVGVCLTMCPEQEMRERERHHLLHPFELKSGSNPRYPVADPKRVVKEFRRPAAGKGVRMCDLRPVQVLVATVKYLLGDLLMEFSHKSQGIFSMDAYNFIFDRLRAVRQDMVIQRISGDGAIFIYEQTLAFLILFGYFLCLDPTFVVKFNETHITECFGQLLALYNLVKDKILHQVSSKGPQSSHHRRFVRNYTLFNSLHVLNTLDRSDSLHRLLNTVPLKLHSKPPVSTAVSIIKSYQAGNYIKFFKILTQDIQSPLMLAILMKHCVFVQVKALNVMHVAYSSKNLSFPLDHLCQILMFTSEEDAKNLLERLGVTVGDNRVIFSKSCDMNIDILPKSKRFRFIDDLIVRFPHFPLKIY